MIHWLTQTAAAHPDLAVGVPPPGVLSDRETAVFDALKTDKRRRDWLLGRWTAKHLVQQAVRECSGQTMPLDGISVLAGSDGAPQVHMRRLPLGSCPVSLSISHSNGTAFCAAVTRPGWPIGADIERIEPRRAEFVAQYFTAAEQALIETITPALRPTWTTAVWSAKEAALKAIHQGLKVDARSVSCLLPAQPEPPRDWVPFTIEWDKQRVQLAPPLDGWWRVDNGYVLTAASKS
jgi:4'-phosphopantetheinyl transferase